MRTLHYQFKNTITNETFEVNTLDEKNEIVNQKNDAIEYIGEVLREIPHHLPVDPVRHQKLMKRFGYEN